MHKYPLTSTTATVMDKTPLDVRLLSYEEDAKTLCASLGIPDTCLSDMGAQVAKLDYAGEEARWWVIDWTKIDPANPKLPWPSTVSVFLANQTSELGHWDFNEVDKIFTWVDTTPVAQPEPPPPAATQQAVDTLEDRVAKLEYFVSVLQSTQGIK